LAIGLILLVIAIVFSNIIQWIKFENFFKTIKGEFIRLFFDLKTFS
jgi:hypothetical protein